MYRCEICTAVSTPGQPKLVFLETKDVDDARWDAKRHSMVRIVRKVGKREIPVCSSCKKKLEEGATPDSLRQTYKEARLRLYGPPAAIPPPLPAPKKPGKPVHLDGDRADE